MSLVLAFTEPCFVIQHKDDSQFGIIALATGFAARTVNLLATQEAPDIPLMNVAQPGGRCGGALCGRSMPCRSAASDILGRTSASIEGFSSTQMMMVLHKRKRRPFFAACNQNSKPFVWTRTEVHRTRLKGRHISRVCFRVRSRDSECC